MDKDDNVGEEGYNKDEDRKEDKKTVVDTISRKVSIERNKIKGEQERIKNAMVIEAVVEIK